MGKYDSWLGVALGSIVAAGTIAAGVLTVIDEVQTLKSKQLEKSSESTKSESK